MNSQLKLSAIFISATILVTSCASSTLIQSGPSGADVYIDSQNKGTTPYKYSDTKIAGTATDITLKKEGYEDFYITLVRNERADVGAIIGGVFLLFPFLWTMKYDPEHTYELTPSSDQTTTMSSEKTQTSNSTNELIKLKNLLDQTAITSEDFTTLKVKILSNEYEYNNSIADQLIKLKGLMDSNLLTKEEYTSQKNLLVKGN